MADNVNLELYQGDDFVAAVTVRNMDGTPADITGYTAASQIRVAPADEDPVIVQTISAVVASPNVNLGINKADTAKLSGRYVWDLQITSPAGITTTIVAGRVVVTLEVTRLAAA